jgi:hypothetical protein
MRDCGISCNRGRVFNLGEDAPYVALACYRRALDPCLSFREQDTVREEEWGALWKDYPANSPICSIQI